MCLVVTFELSIFFASCLTLLAGNLSRSMLLSLIVLETNFSSFKKYQRMSLWSILADSGGYLATAVWVCIALYHSSTDLFPCWKLLSKSNLPLTSFDWGLQNSSNFSQMVSSVKSSVDKFQETYWSMPKSPLHAITFLHCLFSGNMASSHSRMFSHFKCHLRNLWYRPSFTVQSILGPSM